MSVHHPRRRRNALHTDDQEVGRWLISYADFITLLFAFFVVMYSISQVSESKYKVLSDSLIQAFDTPLRSNKPIQIGEISRSIQIVPGEAVKQPVQEEGEDESGNMESQNFASTEDFKELENGLKESLGDLIEQDLAEIKSDANWINITLRSALLFPSGSDVLNDGADPLLEEVSKHLNNNAQLILVHGHTDSIPIYTERFPSNWDLSSARAVAVVRKLQGLQVSAPRMSVEGHGEFQPIASNDTPEGRAKNRRVVISISRKQRLPASQKAEEEVKKEGADTSPADELNKVTSQKEAEPEFNIVRLPGGGILIRGKELPPGEEQQTDKQADEADNNNE